MKTLIYHGSKNIIEKPAYGLGKKNNDYGQGFYCTEIKDMAKEWSVDLNRNGYVNSYSIELDGLNVIDLCSENYTVMNWLALLVQNRVFDIQSDFGLEARQYLLDNFLPKTADVDVIIGYRADDSYFSFAQDFLNNAISVKKLAEAMHLGKLGTQVVLISPKAFDALTYIESEKVYSAEWYPKKLQRDQKARNDYLGTRTSGWTRGETYMMQILEEEIKNDDIRLRPEFAI